MLLFHPLRKTYDDFEEVYQYRMDAVDGTLIETDKELQVNQVIILKDISDYGIIVERVWEEDGQMCFTHVSAKDLIVRARTPRNKE
ncbi:hypothetical protein [Fredinandcohnia quinoae]|uniref:Uncharacterized protein n=1 Tax=Fredinandcohnia quinoae TaxID=2918902 RepID=A0AAW5EB93_9BACI|nr:hypothetical protein [Fredinandcohnia sp. SECRCQ15]MCH1627237.1 hypothetical protein [Fredinandcohnia sp. SECRCQ15]